jgi:hypothetical protein
MREKATDTKRPPSGKQIGDVDALLQLGPQAFLFFGANIGFAYQMIA